MYFTNQNPTELYYRRTEVLLQEAHNRRLDVYCQVQAHNSLILP